MIPVYVASSTPNSGRTFLSLALALKLKEMGISVGYCKPLGKVPVKQGNEVYDADAVFIKEVLGLAEPLDVISPFVMSSENQARLMSGGLQDVKQQVVAALRSMKKKEFVIIGGPNDLFEGSFLDLHPLALAKELKAQVLLVEPWRGEASADSLFGAAKLFGGQFCGGVLNRVPETLMDYAKGAVRPFLERKGIRVFGVFPRDRFLESVTVRQLNEILHGRVLCSDDRLDEHVEHYLIGAMDVDSALNYFRRTPNKAVITGAHRTDIQLAALETSTKCIILTGGFQANEKVLDRAREAGVPVISVSDDTFSTIERIETRMGKSTIRELRKVERAKELVSAEFDMFGFLNRLGKV